MNDDVMISLWVFENVIARAETLYVFCCRVLDVCLGVSLVSDFPTF